VDYGTFTETGSGLSDTGLYGTAAGSGVYGASDASGTGVTEGIGAYGAGDRDDNEGDGDGDDEDGAGSAEDGSSDTDGTDDTDNTDDSDSDSGSDVEALPPASSSSSPSPLLRALVALGVLLLVAVALYILLWHKVSEPLDPVAPPVAEQPVPEAPPVKAGIPPEGCWASDSLAGAAPGGPRRPVLLQVCFSSSETARLAVFDLGDNGTPEDSCMSGASVAEDPDGTLITGDPGGPLCSRAPDTYYRPLRLSCKARPGGDAVCLIDEGEEGDPPLEAVFSRTT
jgi:hypothetical protein